MMWTGWNGGECPVPGEATVSIRLRNGKIINGTRADRWLWRRPRQETGREGTSGGDIVAYCEMEVAG